MTAAVDLGFDAHPRLAAHEQRPHALGAIRFVRRERHQVDLQRPQIDGDLAGGLRGIDVEDDAALAGDLADRGDVLDDADLVVDRHHRHHDGVRTQRGLDQAVVLNIEVGDLEALALELAHRVQRGLMLGLDRDQVAAFVLVELGRPFQSQIDRLGGTRSPDDFPRIAMDQRGHLLTRLLDGLLGRPAIGVAAGRGVAELLTQVRHHLVHNPRVHRGGGRVVEVDWQVKHGVLRARSGVRQLRCW